MYNLNKQLVNETAEKLSLSGAKQEEVEKFLESNNVEDSKESKDDNIKKHGFKDREQYEAWRKKAMGTLNKTHK